MRYLHRQSYTGQFPAQPDPGWPKNKGPDGYRQIDITTSIG